MELENFKYEREKLKSKNKEDSDEDEEKEHTGPVSYFELYKFSTTSDKIMIAAAIVLCVIAGISEAIFSFNFGKCVGAISNFAMSLATAGSETEKLQHERDFSKKLTDFGVWTACISVVVFLTHYGSTFLFNYTAMNQVFKIRELYFSRVLNQDIPWHDRCSTGDFASRTADDLKKFQDGINDKAAYIVIYTAIIFSALIQCLIIGWKLTLVSLLPYPILLIFMAFIEKFSMKLAQDEAELYGEAGKVANEALTYIKTVVAFEGQKTEMKQYRKFLKMAKSNNIKRHLFQGLMFGVASFFSYIIGAILVRYGVGLIVKGRANIGSYTLEEIVTIFDCTVVMSTAVGNITPLFEKINIARGAAQKVFNIIEERPVINKSYKKGTKMQKIQGCIRFHNVQFSYPARKKILVLRNLSLHINAGETVALVGSSGCGKSTIVQLIQRFYDVTQGQITVDDNDIKDLNLDSFRKQIGMVGQEPVLFAATIAENIRLGKLGATQFDIEEAAKKSNAHSFIESLPDGYQTTIGERGTQLSVGQKQMIALARALVRKPAILLLDETTSALDFVSESIIQQSLDEVCKKCTTIIVAHRLSTVRNADRIIYLDNGEIVEEGSHNELMAIKGAYHKLFLNQISSSDGEEFTDPSKIEMTTPHKENNADKSFSTVKPQMESEFTFSIAGKVLKAHLTVKWCLILGLLFSFAAAFGVVTCDILIGRVFAIMSGKDGNSIIYQVSVYSAIIIVAGFVIGTSYIAQMYFIGITGEQLVLNLRFSMFKAMMYKKITWFDEAENGVGSLGARLAGEPSSIQNTIGLCVGPFLNVFIMTVSLIGVGLYLSWKFLLAIFGAIPILIFMIYLEHKILVKENRKNAEIIEQSTKLATEAIANVRIVASLTVEHDFIDRYILKLQSCRKLIVRNIHIQGAIYGFARGSLFASFLISLYYGAHLIRQNEASATTVIAISQILVSCLWNVMNTLTFLPNLTKGFVACNKINELLTEDSYGETPSKSLSSDRGDIDYQEVSFSYPTRPGVEILKNLSLEVLKGKTVALVGPSGCGKSTVVQLLERFFDSGSGKILFGGEDITKVDLGSLRYRMGMVMQEPNLFSKTIEENIAYGIRNRVVSRLEVVEAARNANIHNFIGSLPLGYSTVLGEKGTQLSGGEKQRIAIARALVRDPEVLLLDEATSALDAENEKVVQKALSNAMKERTCIAIAHRLSTIVDSDVIAVVSGGKIAERGTHRELMEKKGLYWDLFTTQHQIRNQ